MAYTDSYGVVHNSFYETADDLEIEPINEKELIEFKRLVGMPISEDYDELIESLKGKTDDEFAEQDRELLPRREKKLYNMSKNNWEV